MSEPEFWLLLIAIIALIIISALFSSSETALTAVSDARIHQFARKGNKKALIVKELKSNKELLISSLLIGNNAVNVLASALATSTAITLFGEGGVAFATITMTILLVVFAEVLPKTYAFNNAESFSLAVAPFVKILYKFLAPASKLISLIIPFFINETKENRYNREEELRGFIKLHIAGGDNEDKEKGAMLSSVLDLQNITVEEVMKHRSNVVMIDSEEKIEKILVQVVESSFTRHPIFSGKQENIIGVLHVKELLKKFKETEFKLDKNYEKLKITDIASEVYFVPETTLLYDQLQSFKKRREHFAVVVDEYGDFRGIITLEDILEEIVGEIDDEHDHPMPGIKSFKDGSWKINGDVTIRDLNRTFEIDLPDNEASTIAGLVIHESRSIPSAGQEFRFHNIKIRVLSKKVNRIGSLKIWFEKISK